MKKQLLTSIIALSSLNSSLLMAEDIDRVVYEKVELNQEIYLTLKTLTLLQVLRVDRSDDKLKIAIKRLPSYLVNEIEQSGTLDIDADTGEMIINEESMKGLLDNRYLKGLAHSLDPNSKIDPVFNTFLRKVNKLDGFDLRDDLKMYANHFFN
jgi:hypothetical protein